jgi:hypothetical protein
VICAKNHARLADIVDRVTPYEPRTMDFWNLWPRLDPDDTRGHFVPVMEARPGLLAALERCVARDVLPIVKWFPRCLLGDFAGYQEDSQPTVLVEQTYWDKAPQFACLYSGVCAHSPSRCSGLSFPYIRRFGWEESNLKPARTPTTLRPAERPRRQVDRWLERLRLQEGIRLSGWVLSGARAEEGGVVLTLSGGESSIDVLLRPRDVGRPCLARTRRFDVCPLDGAHRGAEEPPLRTLITHLRALDGRG